MLQEAACTSAAASGKPAQRAERQTPLPVRNDDGGGHHQRVRDLSHARVRAHGDRGACLDQPLPWCQGARIQAARNTAKETIFIVCK